MFWLIPHLHAAHRRISLVVPVKLPSMRGASSRLALGLSPGEKKLLPTCWPVVRLKTRFTPLFSRVGLARTHRAHRASDGSLAPGGRVGKKPGAAAAAAVLGANTAEAARGDDGDETR